MKRLTYILRAFSLILLIGLIVRVFIIEPTRIEGRSMEPTLHTNTVVLVNKLNLLFRTPKRDDIIQAINPYDNHFVLKRIIGLPHETIYVYPNLLEVKKDNILIASYALSDKKVNINEPIIYSLSDQEYFLLGDNPESSTDSRHYGPVNRSYISGTVIFP